MVHGSRIVGKNLTHIHRSGYAKHLGGKGTYYPIPRCGGAHAKGRVNRTIATSAVAVCCAFHVSGPVDCVAIAGAAGARCYATAGAVTGHVISAGTVCNIAVISISAGDDAVHGVFYCPQKLTAIITGGCACAIRYGTIRAQHCIARRDNKTRACAPAGGVGGRVFECD